MAHVHTNEVIIVPPVPPVSPVPRGNVKCPHCNTVFPIKADPGSTPGADMILSLGISLSRTKCSTASKQLTKKIDGGGIKGYSSLLILKTIMEAVIQEETKRIREENRELSDEELERLKRPSTYFDYIMGTSTGG
jgi:hypothetical protein